MQKLKKALKKLAGLGTSSLKAKAAQPAKKAAPQKKKTQTVVKAAKSAKAAAPAKKAAPSVKVAAKPVAKSAKPQVKAQVKPQAKAPVKDAKQKTPASAKATSAKASEKAGKPEAKSEAKPAKTKEIEAKAPAPTDEAKPAKAGKKAKEEAPAEEEEEIVLLDAEGRRYCRVKDCDQATAVDGYCRYHYLLFWKNIQVRKSILLEGKLDRYIEDLTARYPDKYLEMLKKDLRTEKEFMAAIQELEIDEAGDDSEFEDEAQSYLDEVRGMGSETASDTRDDEF